MRPHKEHHWPDSCIYQLSGLCFFQPFWSTFLVLGSKHDPWGLDGHIQRPTMVTLVTAHNSDASYLNRAELQNWCIALAHANLFIPDLRHCAI